jgi:hypothetical protein
MKKLAQAILALAESIQDHAASNLAVATEAGKHNELYERQVAAQEQQVVVTEQIARVQADAAAGSREMVAHLRETTAHMFPEDD